VEPEPLPKYRFYSLDDHGSITGPSEAIDPADDETATAHAATLTNGCAVEVWSSGCRIAVVERSRRAPGFNGPRKKNAPEARGVSLDGAKEPHPHSPRNGLRRAYYAFAP
jgi:hypothetical protein